MLRFFLPFVVIVCIFGWVAGMTVYKVLQIVFAIVAIIIMLLVGKILLGQLKSKY